MIARQAVNHLSPSPRPEHYIYIMKNISTHFLEYILRNGVARWEGISKISYSRYKVSQNGDAILHSYQQSIRVPGVHPRLLMGCDGISMVFHFTFPTLLHMLNIFSCAYNYVNMFFCRVPILVFCPLFFVILYWLLFIHSKNKSSVRYIHVSFSQCMAYLFTLWMVSLVMSRS
jgi:hypothetical protein